MTDETREEVMRQMRFCWARHAPLNELSQNGLGEAVLVFLGPLLDAKDAELERLRAVVNKARNVWLFSRGYVSEGVEIPDAASEPAIDAEEAARHLAMYRAIEAYDAATAAAERGTDGTT